MTCCSDRSAFGTARCDGDVVVDETILNTAAPDGMLGSRPERYRGASSVARYWARDNKGQIRQPGASGDIKSRGFGVGATFVSRIGRRDLLPARRANGFHRHGCARSTSGSVEGLATALTHARRTGVNGYRGGGRTRRPCSPPTWGTTPSTASPLMLQTGYSPVVRYPKHWNLEYPSAPPPGAPDGPLPGHCNTPAPSTAQQSSNASPGTAPRAPKLLSQDNFGTHDRRLQSIYPFLMGLHSLAMVDCQFGRPRLGSTPPQRVKVRQVCPAALGTVMCSLKASRYRPTWSAYPMAEPDWPAGAFACCCNSSVTVYLTDAQLKMAQWELIPGSWEHTLYFEAARSLHRTTLQSAQIHTLPG